MKILTEIVLVLVGLVAGLLAAKPFDDYVAPHVFATHADLSVVSKEPIGREAIVKVKTRFVLAEHSVYVVVESDGRYWPQVTLKEHFVGEVPIILGAEGEGDIGSTFTVQVLAVSSAANSRVEDYFDQVGDQNSPLRRTGIDFVKVENSVEPPLATLELTRGR